MTYIIILLAVTIIYLAVMIQEKNKSINKLHISLESAYRTLGEAEIINKAFMQTEINLLNDRYGEVKLNLGSNNDQLKKRVNLFKRKYDKLKKK